MEIAKLDDPNTIDAWADITKQREKQDKDKGRVEKFPSANRPL